MWAALLCVWRGRGMGMRPREGAILRALACPHGYSLSPRHSPFSHGLHLPLNT